MPRKAVTLPSLELLRNLFELTSEGRLINKITRTARVAGSFADNSTRGTGIGYRIAFAAGRLYFAHRIIWKLHYGKEPPENIDHINGDHLDNRPDNLRAATHSENLRNQKIRCNNTSGVKGVHYRKDTGFWRAYISINGKRKYLGSNFASLKDAEMVVDLARKKLHGQFARAI